MTEQKELAPCQFCGAVPEPVQEDQTISTSKRRASSGLVVAPLDRPTLHCLDSVRVGGVITEVTRILHFYDISARRGAPMRSFGVHSNGPLHRKATRRYGTPCGRTAWSAPKKCSIRRAGKVAGAPGQMKKYPASSIWDST
jgi:hypothetical protein